MLVGFYFNTNIPFWIYLRTALSDMSCWEISVALRWWKAPTTQPSNITMEWASWLWTAHNPSNQHTVICISKLRFKYTYAHVPISGMDQQAIWKLLPRKVPQPTHLKGSHRAVENSVGWAWVRHMQLLLRHELHTIQREENMGETTDRLKADIQIMMFYMLSTDPAYLQEMPLYSHSLVPQLPSPKITFMVWPCIIQCTYLFTTHKNYEHFCLQIGLHQLSC